MYPRGFVRAGTIGRTTKLTKQQERLFVGLFRTVPNPRGQFNLHTLAHPLGFALDDAEQIAGQLAKLDLLIHRGGHEYLFSEAGRNLAFERRKSLERDARRKSVAWSVARWFGGVFLGILILIVHWDVK
jgi:hypothetical protein